MSTKFKPMVRVTIKWDTDIDEEELEDKEHSEEELPSYVEWEIAEDQIELEMDQETILEELSETYGYLIESADFEIIIEVKDGEAQKS